MFVGWFGPIGVAAIYYALVARTETGLAVTLIAGSLVVFCSILVHGMASTVGTYRYGVTDDSDDSG